MGFLECGLNSRYFVFCSRVAFYNRGALKRNQDMAGVHSLIWSKRVCTAAGHGFQTWCLES